MPDRSNSGPEQNFGPIYCAKKQPKLARRAVQFFVRNLPHFQSRRDSSGTMLSDCLEWFGLFACTLNFVCCKMSRETCISPWISPSFSMLLCPCFAFPTPFSSPAPSPASCFSRISNHALAARGKVCDRCWYLCTWIHSNSTVWDCDSCSY